MCQYLLITYYLPSPVLNSWLTLAHLTFTIAPRVVSLIIPVCNWETGGWVFSVSFPKATVLVSMFMSISEVPQFFWSQCTQCLSNIFTVHIGQKIYLSVPFTGSKGPDNFIDTRVAKGGLHMFEWKKHSGYDELMTTIASLTEKNKLCSTYCKPTFAHPCTSVLTTV